MLASRKPPRNEKKCDSLGSGAIEPTNGYWGWWENALYLYHTFKKRKRVLKVLYPGDSQGWGQKVMVTYTPEGDSLHIA